MSSDSRLVSSVPSRASRRITSSPIDPRNGQFDFYRRAICGNGSGLAYQLPKVLVIVTVSPDQAMFFFAAGICGRGLCLVPVTNLKGLVTRSSSDMLGESTVSRASRWGAGQLEGGID